jgi:hypothetical protein
LFPEQPEAAFATICFSSGVAGSIGFFLLPTLSRLVMAWFQEVPSILAVLGYLAVVVKDTRAT